MDAAFIRKLAIKLEQEREKQHLSVVKLAKKLDVPVNFVFKMENYTYNITVPELLHVLDELNVDFKPFFQNLIEEYIAENKDHHLFDISTWTSEKIDTKYKPTFFEKQRMAIDKGYDPYIDNIEKGKIPAPITHFIRIMVALNQDPMLLLTEIWDNCQKDKSS